jgi:hypothetical protein
MIRALVVGGREDFVRDRIGANLRKVGIEIGWHYDYEHPTQVRRGIPKGCNLVLLLIDMAPHPMISPIREAARHAGVKLVTTQRKWAVMLNDLRHAGQVIDADLEPAGEQLADNADALEARGPIPPPPTPEEEMPIPPPTTLPVRVQTQERTVAKTFEELLTDLKATATALMLAHDVTAITINDEGIDVKQVRSVKVAL